MTITQRPVAAKIAAPSPKATTPTANAEETIAHPEQSKGTVGEEVEGGVHCGPVVAELVDGPHRDRLRIRQWAEVEAQVLVGDGDLGHGAGGLADGVAGLPGRRRVRGSVGDRKGTEEPDGGGDEDRGQESRSPARARGIRPGEHAATATRRPRG
jgi:hypothetical protein